MATNVLESIKQIPGGAAFMTAVEGAIGPFREHPVRTAWDRLSKLPGGKEVFSRLVGEMAPYTGTLGAVVTDLDSGHAVATLTDRRRVRNHLESIHAIALANLGELTTGIAMMYDFPADARGIVTRFEMEYLKKARGTLTCECRTEPVRTAAEQEKILVGEIRNEAGELVARATATWLVRPKA